MNGFEAHFWEIVKNLIKTHILAKLKQQQKNMK